MNLILHAVSLKLLVWLAVAAFPWAVIYAFGYKAFGV
jgi:hypothetical protein